MPEFKPKLVPDDPGQSNKCPKCGYTKSPSDETCEICRNIALAKSGSRSRRPVRELRIFLGEDPNGNGPRVKDGYFG